MKWTTEDRIFSLAHDCHEIDRSTISPLNTSCWQKNENILCVILINQWIDSIWLLFKLSFIVIFVLRPTLATNSRNFDLVKSKWTRNFDFFWFKTTVRFAFFSRFQWTNFFSFSDNEINSTSCWRFSHRSGSRISDRIEKLSRWSNAFRHSTFLSNENDRRTDFIEWRWKIQRQTQVSFEFFLVRLIFEFRFSSRHVAMELLDTERFYVDELRTIIEVKNKTNRKRNIFYVTRFFVELFT